MVARMSAYRSAVLLPVLWLSLALFGCATAHTTAGRDFDATKVSQIVKGKTTSSDILAMFGTPYSKQPKDNDEEMWVYSYAEATAHAQSMGFGVTSSEATGFKKNLYILLKGNKTVSNYTLDEGPIDKRTTTVRPGG